MAVYIDILFLRELLVDGAVLSVTAWVRHIKPNRWRLLGASAFGACYVVLMLFPALSFLFSIAVKVLFSFAMLWIAFGFQSLQHYIRNLAAFYSVNFAAAGAVLGLYFLFMQGSGEVWQAVTFAGGTVRTELKLGLFYFAASLAVGLYVYRAVWAGKRKQELIRSHLAEVRIVIGDREHRCVGLVDTGNQLYDPLTRTPVMVVEASGWSDVFPPSWLEGIRGAQVDRLIAGLDAEPFVWQDRLRLIPFRGVNRGSQFMLALKPDSVTVDMEGKRYETSRVLLGLDGGRLAADGAYQAIIHPSMVDTP